MVPAANKVIIVISGLIASTGCIFAGFDSDFLSGGDGNDELYGDFGEDILEGGKGADYFDCGENYDIVLDYDPGDGDILANNCEEVIKT